MTVALIELIAAKGIFRPRGHFSQLAADHVPFDRLVGQDRYESAALQALTDDAPVGVVGPRGAGKSSLIAHVCSNLLGTHIALRVPVTGADDPTRQVPKRGPGKSPGPHLRVSAYALASSRSAAFSTLARSLCARS